MACAPSKDSDQPGHPPSLIRVFAIRMKKAWVFSYPLSTQRRLIRLGGCPGWYESSLGTHVSLLVLSRGGSYVVGTQIVCFYGELDKLSLLILSTAITCKYIFFLFFYSFIILGARTRQQNIQYYHYFKMYAKYLTIRTGLCTNLLIKVMC